MVLPMTTQLILLSESINLDPATTHYFISTVHMIHDWSMNIQLWFKVYMYVILDPVCHQPQEDKIKIQKIITNIM